MLALGVLGVLLVLQLAGGPLHQWLRLQVFDGYQKLAPRERQSAPAVVVQIDEAAIARYGQWPWPRTLLAQLIDRIAAHHPAVIGVDIIMPEADRMSPTRIPDFAPHMDAELSARLRALPSNDTILARSLEGRPVVLGLAALGGASASGSSAAPRAAPFVSRGGDPFEHVAHFERSLPAVAEIDASAAGRGLVNVEPEGGMVRRVPMLAAVAGTLVPALTVEMLRIATGVQSFSLDLGHSGLRALRLADVTIATQTDGRLWLHFGTHDEARFVSAEDLLEGRAVGDRLAGKAVIVGVTALGLVDRPETPVGTRMNGSEIHAQIIENIFEGSWLSRPTWAAWLEALWLAAAGGLGLLALARMSTRSAVLVALAIFIVGPAGGFLLYREARLLIDGFTPSIAFALLFGSLLAMTLAESERRRRELNSALLDSREASARFEGELEAARRVQLGMLPFAPDVVGNEARVDIDAYMQPARMVGGDLYDFFALDDEHLFVSVGDVSGKGMGASMFMGVSKALTKSAALRVRESVAYIVTEANADISLDNPDNLFVTMVAGILHLTNGRFEYCNAGHDAPYLLRASGSVERLALEGGPPLCVLEGYAFSATGTQLAPGDTLILFTDGLTEASDGDHGLYGHARFEAVLARLGPSSSIGDLADAIRADVERFVEGSEQSDDFTLVLLRWNGP